MESIPGAVRLVILKKSGAYITLCTRLYFPFVSSIDLIRLQLHHPQLQHLQLQHSSLHTLTQSHPPPTMHFSLVSLALLTTSALAITPVLNEPPFFHSMLARGADLSARQDSAYQPTTTNCTGGGDTCETMCGKETTECPTDDKEKLFCRQKGTSRCCSDRSGNSCNRGYYCSSNDLGEHYCCLDGQGMSSFQLI
jgi:hypothetical protein